MWSIGPRSPVRDPHRVAAAEKTAIVVADAEPGLVRLTRLARDLLAVDVALVSIVDGERELLCGVVGLPEPYLSGSSVPAPESLCARMVDAGAPLFLPDLAADAELRDHAAVVKLGLRSYAGIPLLSGDLVVGGFCALAEPPRRWTDDDKRVLHDLAGAVATELQLRSLLQQLARSVEAEHRLAAELAAVNRVATAVARGQDPDEVVVLAAQEVAGLLDVDSVVVVRFRPDGRADVAASAGPVQSDASLCSVVVADLRLTGVPTADQSGAVPCLAAPITVSGHLWGALVAAGQGGSGGLDQVARLAELLGVGVANAEAERRLVELSRTDPLTGAANRRAFGERLAEELERARRQDACTTLVLLDLDRFKVLNDENGHLTGDRVLCELVARVTAELRTGDLLARLGGDEFAVVLPSTDYVSAALVVERIGTSVAETLVAGVPLTVSLGAAVLERGQATPEQMYRVADAALYRAKVGGRASAVLDRVV